MTTVEELGPYAVTFHLRDAVVYDHPDGIAVQWVPLGEGTHDFKAIVARAAELVPANVRIYCKPITARPPDHHPCLRSGLLEQVVPRCARSRDLARFLTLARRGRPYDKPHLLADVAGDRERFMDALKVQQLDHMQRSLDYCRKTLDLRVSAGAASKPRSARPPIYTHPIPAAMPRVAALLLFPLALAAQSTTPADAEFAHAIRPALAEHCGRRHNPANPKNRINFLKAQPPTDIESMRGVWRNVAVQLTNRTMPPASDSKISEADRLRLAQWIHRRLEETACRADAPPYAGTVTLRRLNRREYHNSIRDLFGCSTSP